MLKILPFLILTALLVIPPTGSCLAGTSEAEPLVAPVSVSYRLQPGDTVEVTVSGEPDYSGEFLLGSAGSIIFADGSVGEIKITGLTLDEAKNKLTETLSEYLREPAVSFRISKFRILISGEVKQPGSYEVSAGETVMDVIARAGGPTRQVALSVVELRRADDSRLLLEPAVFLATGDVSQNLILQPGDEIVVGRSELTDEYKVSGAVQFPGIYPLSKTRETRLFDALDAAGRWTPEADVSRAILVKSSGEQISLDVGSVDSSPNNPNNRIIEAGDEIFIPRMITKITIQGGVNNPGEYFVEEGTTFLQAVGKAGGLKSNAILDECVLVRSKPDIEWSKVDLEKVLREGKMDQNPVIKDGDMLWIAERGPGEQKRDAFEIFRGVIAPLLWLL